MNKLEQEIYTADELEAIIEPNVWAPPDVEEQPSVQLNRWSVAELEDGDRHFIGWCGEGRVSSKIVSYDKETKIGVTRSGRRYKLMGETGYSSDGDYVWHYWQQVNKVTSYKNVSEEY